MTLEEAEQSTTHLIDLMAEKQPDACCRVSQLRGNTAPMIYDAFCLVIAARRHVGRDDPALYEISHDYADKAEALLGSLDMVLSDDDMDRLDNLQKGTHEFHRVRIDAVLRRMAQCELEWRQKPNRESFSRFNEYCWSLNPGDPLYWQRIYTHLGVPYDENCPIGEGEMTLNDRGHLGWKFGSVGERQKMPLYRFFFLAIGAFLLIWLLAKAVM